MNIAILGAAIGTVPLFAKAGCSELFAVSLLLFGAHLTGMFMRGRSKLPDAEPLSAPAGLSKNEDSGAG